MKEKRTIKDKIRIGKKRKNESEKKPAQKQEKYTLKQKEQYDIKKTETETGLFPPLFLYVRNNKET